MKLYLVCLPCFYKIKYDLGVYVFLSVQFFIHLLQMHVCINNGWYCIVCFITKIKLSLILTLFFLLNFMNFSLESQTCYNSKDISEYPATTCFIKLMLVLRNYNYIKLKNIYSISIPCTELLSMCLDTSFQSFYISGFLHN